MERYQVSLGPETRRWYAQVARQAGLPLEQVLSDALFKLAGELSLEALAASRPQGAHDGPGRPPAGP